MKILMYVHNVKDIEKCTLTVHTYVRIYTYVCTCTVQVCDVLTVFYEVFENMLLLYTHPLTL